MTLSEIKSDKDVIFNIILSYFSVYMPVLVEDPGTVQYDGGKIYNGLKDEDLDWWNLEGEDETRMLDIQKGLMVFGLMLQNILV